MLEIFLWLNVWPVTFPLHTNNIRFKALKKIRKGYKYRLPYFPKLWTPMGIVNFYLNIQKDFSIHLVIFKFSENIVIFLCSTGNGHVGLFFHVYHLHSNKSTYNFSNFRKYYICVPYFLMEAPVKYKEVI